MVCGILPVHGQIILRERHRVKPNHVQNDVFRRMFIRLGTAFLFYHLLKFLLGSQPVSQPVLAVIFAQRFEPDEILPIFRTHRQILSLLDLVPAFLHLLQKFLKRSRLHQRTIHIVPQLVAQRCVRRFILLFDAPNSCRIALLRLKSVLRFPERDPSDSMRVCTKDCLSASV